MNYKNTLKELRDRVFGIEKFEESSLASNTNHTSQQKSVKPMDLDEQVDDFIDWYYTNMVEGMFSGVGEYRRPKEMRNLIEKIAVWYELRYPDYDICRIFSGSSVSSLTASDIMFKTNPYVQDLLDEDSDIKELDWDEFYNKNAFFRSLSSDERRYFARPRYRELVYIDNIHYFAHLHLSSSGIVQDSSGIGIYTNSRILDKDIIGWHVEDVVQAFKENNIFLPEGNEFEETIENAKKWRHQREEILNCAMYRIIERGGRRIGPCRAFLFAQEFKRNINVPMIYGVDYRVPGLRDFINDYLKAGGSLDLMCYVDYFSRENKDDELKVVSIAELLTKARHNSEQKYTPEEVELQQKLVSIFNSQIDQKDLEKEKVKQLRIERKLQKSRNNKSK